MKSEYGSNSRCVVRLRGISRLVGWLYWGFVNVALEVFQPYWDLEAGDNQFLKFKWRGRESNPGPLAPQAKILTTRSPQLPGISMKQS